MKTIDSKADGKGLTLGIVASKFNELVVDGLIQSAVDAFVEHGGSKDDVILVRCAGAFELPLVAQRLVERDECDAVLCLGAVIRGGTPHFEYVSDAATRGISEVALAAPVPVVFGLLTTDDVQQAVERLGKGREVLIAALELHGVYRQLEEKV